MGVVPRTQPQSGRAVLRLALVYMLFATCWVLVTDMLVEHFAAGSLREALDNAKGLLFVVVSTAFFSLQLGRRDRQWQAAEEALQGSEERLREMAESIEDVFYLRDIASGKLLYLSPAYQTLWQGDPSEVLADPTAWMRALHPEDRPRVESTWSEEQKHGTWDQEYRIVRPDGSLRWIHSRAFSIKDPAGRTVRVAGVARDVTESKLQAQALQVSSARLELALRSSRTGVWEWDIPTGAVHWSPECLEMTGVERMENHHDFRALVHPDDAPAHWEKVGRALADRTGFQSEFRVLNEKGRVVWLSAYGVVRCDPGGTPVQVLGTATDVTARRESEDAYRSLFELAPEAILIQCEGRVAMANEALIKLVGATRLEDLLGRPVFDLVHPRDRDLIRERMRLTNQEKQVLSELTRVTFLRLDGTPVEVEALASPFVYRGQNGSQVILLNVTERVRAEQERAQLEARLQEAQKMEAVGQLAGGVAHDFNNLLTVMEGNTTLLRRLELPGDGQALAGEILESVRRAALLTQQLLLFSRKKAMDRRPLSLSQVTGNVLRMLRRVLGEDVTITSDLASDLPAALADEIMLEQIIMNLALNARDAMPHGGQLFLATRAECLTTEQADRMQHAAPGEYVRLTVRDSGTGIPRENLPHIFEPFFTTKDVGRGTGLGLATVYGIVQQHNGCLEVESSVGQGTSFHIYLPANHQVAASCPAPSQAPAAPTQGHETILLVEDDPALRRLAERILSRSGYHVLAAADGAEALRLWISCRTEVDMVLSDLVMPGGLTGLQLSDKLRADRPELKVLFTSGYSAELLEQRAARPESKTMFLNKPYSPQRLTEAVRRCLDDQTLAS